MIVIIGLISSSSVLANTCRIIDEKLETCIPCGTEEVAGIKKKRVAGKKRG